MGSFFFQKEKGQKVKESISLCSSFHLWWNVNKCKEVSPFCYFGERKRERGRVCARAHAQGWKGRTRCSGLSELCLKCFKWATAHRGPLQWPLPPPHPPTATEFIQHSPFFFWVVCIDSGSTVFVATRSIANVIFQLSCTSVMFFLFFLHKKISLKNFNFCQARHLP